MDAGEALRQAEVEAAQDGGGMEPHPMGLGRSADQSVATLARQDLEKLSIDDLRKVASDLHVPDRSKIIEKSDLIDEISKRI